MKNPLYEMMITNAAQQLKSQDPNKPNKDDFTIWEISATLAMVLCKTKEDIIADILREK